MNKPVIALFTAIALLGAVPAQAQYRQPQQSDDDGGPPGQRRPDFRGDDRGPPRGFDSRRDEGRRDDRRDEGRRDDRRREEGRRFDGPRPFGGAPVGFRCRTRVLTCGTPPRPLGSPCSCETDDGDEYSGRVRP